MLDPKFKIVFLHGFGFNQKSWNSTILDRLHSDAKVINHCFTGFGETVFYKQNFTSISTKIVDKYLIGDSINIIVGHSMGGYIALELLNNYPIKIHGVILVNSHPWNDSQETKKLRNKQIEKLKIIPPYRYLRQFYINLDKENWQELFNTFANGITSNTLSHYLTQMRDRPNYEHLLKEKDNSIGVILGKNDALINFDHAKTMLDYPGVKVYIENQGNHLSPLNYPDDIIKAIEEIKDYLSLGLL